MSPNDPIAPSEMEAATEMIDQTNDQFVDFELRLNNQDQYNSGEESGDNEDQISENIVNESLQSSIHNEAHKKLQENLRIKIQKKKEEE